MLTGVSVPTICRLLDTSHYSPPNKLPEAVSIDNFKENASTEKYLCILIDLKNTGFWIFFQTALRVIFDYIIGKIVGIWRLILHAQNSIQ